MVKRGRSAQQDAPVSSHRLPTIKFTEASRLADKNSRTIMKISQLLDIVHQPGYSEADPKRVVEKHIEKLKLRVNRRLTKLARWSDSSSEERQSEFRVFALRASTRIPTFQGRTSYGSQQTAPPQATSSSFARASLPAPAATSPPRLSAPAIPGMVAPQSAAKAAPESNNGEEDAKEQGEGEEDGENEEENGEDEGDEEEDGEEEGEEDDEEEGEEGGTQDGDEGEDQMEE